MEGGFDPSGKCPGAPTKSDVGVSQKSYFRPAPHSPSSPGLASSDFYLFETINRKPACLEFGTAEELFGEVTDATRVISNVALIDAVREWEHRLQECTDMEQD
jgi:hypothetical protein